MRHPHVWVMTDDIYEHLTYDGFEFCTPAQVEPRLYDAHAHLQRGLQGLCHDRLAHRLCCGPGGADRRDAHDPVAIHLQPLHHQPVGGGRGADGPQDFIAENNKVFKRRRDLVLASLRAVDGIDCPTPEGAFYVYAMIDGLMGRTSRAARGSTATRPSPLRCWKRPAWRWCSARLSGFHPAFRVSYATS